MASDCEIWAGEVEDRGGEIVRCPECGSNNAYKVGMELRCWCLEVDDKEVGE